MELDNEGDRLMIKQQDCDNCEYAIFSIQTWEMRRCKLRDKTILPYKPAKGVCSKWAKLKTGYRSRI